MALAAPGDRLGEAAELVPGKGCYTAGKFIYSSLLGKVKFSSIPEEASKQLVEVVRRTNQSAPVLPSMESVVIAKVQSISPKAARVDIVCVDETPVIESFPATIRLQDVKQGPCDDLQMALCYRPGDYVRAVVISLGDSRSYVLSTAQDHLGVIYAKREGVQMAVLDANTLM